MISYTFVPMAKVERLRALERQPIYTPSISMPTPSRTPSKVGTVYTKVTPVVSEVTPVVSEIRNREYISKLSRAIGSDRDKISALETELRKLRDRPETRVEYEEVRHTIDYDISDLKRLLDSPAQRFIDDFAIPVMTVGSALFPGTSVATAPAVATTCARFIPTLGRAAIAFGAEEAYQRITTFFSEKSKGGERGGTTGYKEGKAWDSLISVDNPVMQQKIGKINKQAFGGGQMRTDGEHVFRFDPAHKTGKIHMEMYKKTARGWQPYAECDAQTGKILEASLAEMKKREVIRW